MILLLVLAGFVFVGESRDCQRFPLLDREACVYVAPPLSDERGDWKAELARRGWL